MDEHILKQTRNLGIDLLRILSMFMICILHTLNKGALETETFSAIYEISWFIECFAICAVNVYALISGYVGVNSNHKYTNIVNLWLQTTFYSVIFMLLFFLFGDQKIALKSIVGTFLPVSFSKYWFFTAYFALYLISPFLNKMIHFFEKKDIERLLIICTVLFSLMPTIFLKDMFLVKDGYSFLWLTFLYTLGGYIKKYNPFAKIKPRIVGVLFIASAALTFLSKLFIEILTNRFLGAPTYGDLLVTYNSPTILFSALMLLVLFVQIKPKFNKLITKVTPLVFGIYLIHENEYIRPILKEYLEPITDLPVYIFPVVVICIGAGIFLICLVIEFFRFKLFNLLKIKQFVSFLDELFTKKMNGG